MSKTMVIIETAGCTVRVDGDDVDLDEVLVAWQSVCDRMRYERQVDAEAKVQERPRLDGGSVTGFVIEQADEWLNEKLPGGSTR